MASVLVRLPACRQKHMVAQFWVSTKTSVQIGVQTGIQIGVWQMQTITSYSAL